VDELFWHSSPFLGNRARWSAVLAKEVMTDQVEEKSEPRTHEAMFLLARTDGTWLFEQLNGQSAELSEDRAFDHWRQGYNLGGSMRDRVRKDIDLVPWSTYKVSEAVGEDQDGSDPRVEEQKWIRSPSGLLGRPRTLSNAEEQQKWKIVQPEETDESSSEDGVEPEGGKKPQPIATKGRNFLRTWVRVKPIK
jgi:hypothetical protein